MGVEPRGGEHTRLMLTYDESQSLLDAARRAASELGIPMTVAVMDPAGHLLALARMDGAPWITVDIAQGKAWTAAAYGMPSAGQKSKLEPMPIFAAAITTMTHGRFTPQTGAVPVYRDGELAGAVGASGGTGDQDEQVCRTAVESAGFSVDR